MCRLSAISVNTNANKYQDEIRKIFYILMFLSANENPDGGGILFENGEIYKRGYDFSLLCGMLKKINSYPIPIIGHVRKATKGKVSDENSHPFNGERFVLAHNGSLNFIEKIEHDKTDSETFLNILEEKKRKGNKSIVELINDALEETIGGKFAFLIFDKESRKLYILRDETRTLFIGDLIINGENIGKIVNTSSEVLIRTSVLSSNLGIDVNIKNIDKIKENIIFSLENGELKEEGKVEIENQISYYPAVWEYKDGGFVIYSTSDKDEELWGKLEKMFSLDEIDRFLLGKIGKGVVELRKGDLSKINAYIDEMYSSFSKEKKELWGKIKERGLEGMVEIPYPLVKTKKLRAILRKGGG